MWKSLCKLVCKPKPDVPICMRKRMLLSNRYSDLFIKMILCNSRFLKVHFGVKLNKLVWNQKNAVALITESHWVKVK